MKLCTNRPEGFGPKSTLSSPIPTTCFLDTTLVPLPIWLALLILPILFLLSLQHRKKNFNPNTTHLRQRHARTCLYTTTNILYYGLILANILMQILEIVRLELLNFGIGLLPFVFVGLLLGAALHWSEGVRGRVRGWQGVNAVLWGGGVAMCVVKVVGLDNEGIDGRKGSKYPVADQVTDVAVMAGVYAAIAVLEGVLMVWRRSRKSKVTARSDAVSEDGREMWPNK